MDMHGNSDGGHRQAVAWLGALARALAIGLAAGIALAAAALFLSHAAQAAEAAAAAREPVTRGTVLLRGADEASSLDAPLLHTDVVIRVTGFVARTRVEQRFANPYAEWKEGVYAFPLPPGAAVDSLTMRIGDRTVEGEIKERGAARRDYDAAKSAGRRAALVESERPNLFTSSVANVAPHAEITIAIEYQEAVRFENGRFSLRFPMVAGPRYLPASVPAAEAARLAQPVRRPETGAAPEPGAPSAVSNPVNLRVDLDAGVALAALYAPYHKIVVSDVGSGHPGRTRIALAEGVVSADRDFELVWQPVAGKTPQSALFRESRDGKQYALLMVLPPEPAARAERMPREAIFVIDTSGSMQGTSIEQARAGLELALERLAPEDRFNVIEFNSTARALHRSAQPATPANVAAARRWVARLAATGGTEMAKALDLALDGREHPGFVRQIVFLTDGAVGNEDELFRMIRARLGDSRLFTVGIGSAPNSHFMTKAAAEGRGTFTYIGRIDEVRTKMGELFAKLESPMLRDVRVDWPGAKGVEAWPERVPDLYAGEPVFVIARLDGAGDALAARVAGTRGGASWDAALKVVDPSRAAGLDKLWARHRLDALADAERAGGAGARDAMIALALEHHLVSKYTALVAVDKTPARPADAGLSTAAIPANLPEGWRYEGVYGEMPQTATPATLHALLGALALLAATLVALGERRRRAREGVR